MDISKFNEELAYKVAKANGLEKNNRIQEAIRVWIEITEMVISMSKLPNLDFSFRSMLIERTEGIIKHIKELKLSISVPLKNHSKLILKPPDTTTDMQEVARKNSKPKKSDLKGIDIPSIQEQRNPSISEVETSETDKKDLKIIKSDDIGNLPKGFKEIETSEDFTIITPHDKEYVEKILKQDIDMNIFKLSENKNADKKEKSTSKSNSNPKILICFACGTELPTGTKNCPNCGTKVE